MVSTRSHVWNLERGGKIIKTIEKKRFSPAAWFMKVPYFRTGVTNKQQPWSHSIDTSIRTNLSTTKASSLHLYQHCTMTKSSTSTFTSMAIQDSSDCMFKPIQQVSCISRSWYAIIISISLYRNIRLPDKSSYLRQLMEFLQASECHHSVFGINPLCIFKSNELPVRNHQGRLVYHAVISFDRLVVILCAIESETELTSFRCHLLDSNSVILRFEKQSRNQTLELSALKTINH
jgi:hypothetical protein